VNAEQSGPWIHAEGTGVADGLDVELNKIAEELVDTVDELDAKGLLDDADDEASTEDDELDFNILVKELAFVVLLVVVRAVVKGVEGERMVEDEETLLDELIMLHLPNPFWHVFASQ
jgi:hypothetical protein